MAIRVHHEAQLAWRKMGDIPMGWMSDHIDPTELEGHLSFHEPGDTTTMQLMEMRLNPHTLIAPHSHDDDEIFFMVEGAGARRWRLALHPRGHALFVPHRRSPRKAAEFSRTGRSQLRAG